MPPLRERLADLPLLVRAMLTTIAKDRELDVHIEPDQALLETLSRHSWPGNVRELRNYLEQLVILRMAPSLGDGDAAKVRPPLQGEAPYEGLQKLPLRMAKAELLERFERQYVTQLLEQTGGNVAEAARRAGVDRVTLFRTIRRYGLKGQST
jgi:DNA-binding NtrC family response regulator